MMKKSNKPSKDNFSARHGFSMSFKADEKYYFQFNDLNGEPLLFSKGYNTEKSCAEGIHAIIRSTGVDEQYELNETKKGKHFFILKSRDQKEICRSRMFDAFEELEIQLELLKGIDEDVPQFGITGTIAQKKVEVPVKKENTSELESHSKLTNVAVDRPPAESEDTEKMPRYKFSVIYYPDSKIWTIKNDFSGDSTKMKTCDGQQIENFIRIQLPTEELGTRLDIPLTEIKEVPSILGMPPTPSTKETLAPAIEPALQEIDLMIRTQQGELIKGFAEIGSIGKVQLSPNVRASALPLAFDIKVMAKSLEDNQTLIIGLAHKQELVNGQLEVPIHGGYGLKKGPYRFSVDIVQISRGEQKSIYYGSQLIMMK